MSPLKRKAENETTVNAKKARIVVPDYHLASPRRDESGEIVWPAPAAQIDRARDIIRECAQSQKPTVILPDKDADGLSAGVILHRTLTALGLSPSLLSTYLPPKGTTVHDDTTRDAISARSPSYIFILDQGSRRSRPIIEAPHECLIIDHHWAEEGGFPEGAEYVTAHDCPPVATTSLLVYHICEPLHTDIQSKTSWLAALGTHGDLGATLKWVPPFPDMTSTFARFSKKAINDAVALINAPRRSAAYNVSAAWDVLLAAEGPETILKNETLKSAAGEVQRETDRCAHTAPKFSADATIAVLTISSAAQVHPIIATRWAGTLKSSKMEVIMCANEGYLPDKVNFSCRVAKCARGRTGDEKVDIIKKLEGIVADNPDLRARLGDSFARGHKEASGGVVGKEEWEEFKKAMGVGEAVRKKKSEDAATKSVQKNTLANYFKRAEKA